MYIIGIDGGGTKTEALLFHTEKGKLATFTEKASNPHSTSFSSSVEVVAKLIREILDSSYMDSHKEVYVGIGIAGLGREEDKQKWMDLFKQSSDIFSKIKDIAIASDAETALYSGTYGDDGIVSICGTGSISFGIHKNHIARVGGWGHLVDADPGSGYYIGHEALKAVFNSFDGLIPATAITQLIHEAENMTETPQLIKYIYKNIDEKDKIASFAKHVFTAAEMGDEIAREIIDKAASVIVANGIALHRKLFTNDEQSNIPFVLVGGIFNNRKMVSNITNLLKSESRLQVIQPTYPPVYGSVVLLLKNRNFTSETIEKIMNP